MSELVTAARRLAPEFAARAQEFEDLRRIPADVSSQMAVAGFYRMFIPEALGGLECPPAEAVEVLETLATGDASCGWVAFIGATSGTALVGIPEAAARMIFAGPESLVTGVFAPSGRAELCDGGFQVSGRWQWGSGSENANWILGGCQLHQSGETLRSSQGVPQSHMLLFPKDAVQLLDTWHVSGLRGTGSTDFEVQDLFVPAEHAVGYLVRENPERPLYQFPQFTLLALGIAAVTWGCARGAIDDLVTLAADKVRAGSSNALINRPHTQMEVAKAEARLRSARAFYYDALAAAWDLALRGEPVPVTQRRNLRLATTHAVGASAEVVDAMYTLAGGSSVYQASHLQRRFRDVHVATQHIMVASSTLETLGRLYLGLETNTQTL